MAETDIKDLQLVQLANPTTKIYRLSKKVGLTDTTITLNAEPLDETGASITKDFLISIGVENMLVTDVTGAVLTVVRGVPRGGEDLTGNSDNATTHDVGDEVVANVAGFILQQYSDALQGNIGSTIKFNARPTYMGAGSGALRVFANTTARDSALTPAQGDKCYITGTGEQHYDGSSWVDLGVSTAITASLGVEKVGNDLRLDIASGNDIVKLTGNELDTNLTADKTEIDQLAGTTNIAEADTFFGATDITGSEAQTLTGGASADSLHTHGLSQINFGASEIPNASTRYLEAYTGTSGTAIVTEGDNSSFLCARAGTIKNLYIKVLTNGASTHTPFTVRKNGVSQTLTASLLFSTLTAEDTTHSFTVAKGDLISVVVVNPGGGASILNIWTSMIFE